MKNIKRSLVGIIVLGLVAGGVYLTRRQPSSGGDKMRVTASFYPMAEFARQVGGSKVEVTTLVKPGLEPHDYDPSPQDLVGVYSSKVLVYNGAGLEAWVGRIQSDLIKNNVVTVNASSSIKLLAPYSNDEALAGQASDPHVWLDPVLAQKEVDNITAGFIQANPSNAGYYQQNAAVFKQKLSNLDVAYRQGLASCQRRDIITSHQAFRYLSVEYNLNSLGIAGLSPDNEPSPQKLAEVADFARQHNIKYIFFETLVSPKLSDTIAREVGAQTIVFNPLEGLTPDEIAQGKSYLSVQQDNINNLRIALDCK